MVLQRATPTKQWRRPKQISVYPNRPSSPVIQRPHLQAAFPSLVFLANQDFPPAAKNQQQHSAAVLPANQVSQQQQTTTSGIPQPSFSWPIRIHQQQLPAQSSILRQYSRETRVPSSSKQDKRPSQALFFLAKQNSPLAATNQQHHCAAFSG